MAKSFVRNELLSRKVDTIRLNQGRYIKDITRINYAFQRLISNRDFNNQIPFIIDLTWRCNNCGNINGVNWNRKDTVKNCRNCKWTRDNPLSLNQEIELYKLSVEFDYDYHTLITISRVLVKEYCNEPILVS